MATFTLKQTTVIRRHEITDGKPVALRYSSNGVQFLPVKVDVTFENGEFHSVKVWGSNLKRDGSTGANSHDRTWSASGWDGELPEWLRPITDFSYGD